ncbi:MAG: PIN domain-containing protein [Myxococcota bacterium]
MPAWQRTCSWRYQRPHHSRTRVVFGRMKYLLDTHAWIWAADIAVDSEQFSSRFPKDPADRLIGATARVHGLTLLTRDENIRRSREVATLW